MMGMPSSGSRPERAAPQPLRAAHAEHRAGKQGAEGAGSAVSVGHGRLRRLNWTSAYGSHQRSAIQAFAGVAKTRNDIRFSGEFVVNSRHPNLGTDW